MPFTPYALDEFYSQEISQLTECNAPEIKERFSQADYWVANFFLNSVFGSPINHKVRAFGFGFLRRCETAFLEYEIARKFLMEFVQSNYKKPSFYLKALTHFELAISMSYQAYQIIINVSDEKLYKKNDGSIHQRLNQLYNEFRHCKLDDLPLNHFHIMWITNEGFETNECKLSFSEFEELMIEIGELADKVSKIRKS